MPDLMTISAAIASLKNATDIARFLKDSDASLERAEWKFKLADLMSALAEAKIQLAEVQDVLSEKDARIAELEEAFRAKDSLVREGDAYYLPNAEGKASGKPFCLRCWEVDHQKRALVYSPKDHRVRLCSKCKSEYEGRSAHELP